MSALRSWLRRHRHAASTRIASACVAEIHARARDWFEPHDAPGRSPSFRARCVPFPPPRPVTRVERAEVARVLSRQHTSAFDGDAVRTFEAEFARRVGVDHAIAVSSGTAALHASLAALGIGPGDEVVVPVLTYVSCALAPMYLGARPVFVDAHPTSWNVDPAAIEAAIGPRTRAILVVHLAGVPCDMEPILDLARRHGLALIEDAAQAHGSLVGGRHVGSLGTIGCFSFQSSKTIVTGEGGMIVTSDDALARRARLARNLGETLADASPSLEALGVPATENWGYPALGWNYRMGAVQAALGLGQMKRFDDIVSASRRNASYLREELGSIEGLEFQVPRAGDDPCPSAFFVDLRLVGGEAARDDLARALAREKVDFRLPYRRPLSGHAIFDAAGRFPVAERLCREVIGFRVDGALGRRECEAVGFALRRFFAVRRGTSSQSND